MERRAAADSAVRFLCFLEKHTDLSGLLIDVFCFSVKKSKCVPSFSFIRVDMCEISKNDVFFKMLICPVAEMGRNRLVYFRSPHHG
jgi:hypothetical protein